MLNRTARGNMQVMSIGDSSCMVRPVLSGSFGVGFFIWELPVLIALLVIARWVWIRANDRESVILGATIVTTGLFLVGFASTQILDPYSSFLVGLHGYYLLFAGIIF